MSLSRRDLLHRTHLTAFAEYLSQQGWEIEPLKGDFEVLRVRKDKTVHVFYERASDRANPDGLGGSTHITVDKRALHLVHNFIRERSNARSSTDSHN